LPFDLQVSLAALDRLPHRGQAAKLPEDLDRYAAIIRATAPEMVVECGTWQGYSAEWFAGHDLDVVTIDVDPGHSAWVREHGGSQRRITYLAGSSTDPQVVAQVAELAAGRRTMAVLDSDHSAVHVHAEIMAYGPLVSPGCYLVVEDGICRWLPSTGHGGPLDAVEAFLDGDPGWRRDKDIEDLHPISTNPMGWWLRVPQ
jgi:cephalosporin hydroxylase